jgi:hypothetical protein
MEEFIYDIITPIFVEPKTYELVENTYKGGFYSFPNVLFSKNEDLKYQISSNILNIVNKSQNQSIYINTKYLNYILYSNIENIEKLTGLNLINYNDNYLDSKVKDIKKIPDIFLIHEFFLAIYIAIEFQHIEFYFISKLDERGRKYDVGYPLNFQRDKILRNLFLLNKNKILEDINEPFHSRFKHFEIYSNYLNNVAFKEKEYNIFNILQNPIECIVGFDASSQVYQIIGGLLKEKNMLHLSNIINIDGIDTKNDIYIYFLNKLQEILNNSQYLKLLINNLNEYMHNINSVKKIKDTFALNLI